MSELTALPAANVKVGEQDFEGRRVSLIDGANHGLYSGIADAIFPALLTLTHSPAFIFNILVHGSSLVTILFQWLSAVKTSSHNQPQTVLVVVCALQSLLLILLFLTLLYFPEPGAYFSYLVCFVSIASLAAGNYSSPLFHAIWAALMPVNERISHIAHRTKIMYMASLVSVAGSFFIFQLLGTRGAILVLLSVAAAAKAYSACLLGTDRAFAEVSLLRASLREKSSAEISCRRLLVFCPFYFSLGIAAGYLIPHLSINLKFSVQDIFYLSSIQYTGQILIMTLLKKQSRPDQLRNYFTGAIICCAALPFFWCIAESFADWSIVFLFSGFILGAISIGITQIVHQMDTPSNVAKAQASAVSCTSLSMIAGGLFGILIMYFSPYSGCQSFILLFICSAILRVLSIAAFFTDKFKLSLD